MPNANQPRVPEGLRSLMKSLTKQVLRERPKDVCEFSAQYFENILHCKENLLIQGFEPFQNTEELLKRQEQKEIPLAMVFSIIPKDFTELLKEFTKAVLRKNPNNICEFAIQFFRRKQNAENCFMAETTLDSFFRQKERFLIMSDIKCTCGRYLHSNINQQQKTEISEKSWSNLKSEKTCFFTKEYRNEKFITAIKILQRAIRRFLNTKRKTASKQKFFVMTPEKASLIILRTMRKYKKIKNTRQGQASDKHSLPITIESAKENERKNAEIFDKHNKREKPERGNGLQLNYDDCDNENKGSGVQNYQTQLSNMRSEHNILSKRSTLNNTQNPVTNIVNNDRSTNSKIFEKDLNSFQNDKNHNFDVQQTEINSDDNIPEETLETINKNEPVEGHDLPSSDITNQNTNIETKEEVQFPLPNNKSVETITTISPPNESSSVNVTQNKMDSAPSESNLENYLENISTIFKTSQDDLNSFQNDKNHNFDVQQKEINSDDNIPEGTLQTINKNEAVEGHDLPSSDITNQNKNIGTKEEVQCPLPSNNLEENIETKSPPNESSSVNVTQNKIDSAPDESDLENYLENISTISKTSQDDLNSFQNDKNHNFDVQQTEINSDDNIPEETLQTINKNEAVEGHDLPSSDITNQNKNIGTKEEVQCPLPSNNLEENIETKSPPNESSSVNVTENKMDSAPDESDLENYLENISTISKTSQDDLNSFQNDKNHNFDVQQKEINSDDNIPEGTLQTINKNEAVEGHDLPSSDITNQNTNIETKEEVQFPLPNNISVETITTISPPNESSSVNVTQNKMASAPGESEIENEAVEGHDLPSSDITNQNKNIETNEEVQCPLPSNNLEENIKTKSPPNESSSVNVTQNKMASAPNESDLVNYLENISTISKTSQDDLNSFQNDKNHNFDVQQKEINSDDNIPEETLQTINKNEAVEGHDLPSSDITNQNKNIETKEEVQCPLPSNNLEENIKTKSSHNASSSVNVTQNEMASAPYESDLENYLENINTNSKTYQDGLNNFQSDKTSFEKMQGSYEHCKDTTDQPNYSKEPLNTKDTSSDMINESHSKLNFKNNIILTPNADISLNETTNIADLIQNNKLIIKKVKTVENDTDTNLEHIQSNKITIIQHSTSENLTCNPIETKELNNTLPIYSHQEQTPKMFDGIQELDKINLNSEFNNFVGDQIVKDSPKENLVSENNYTIKKEILADERIDKEYIIENDLRSSFTNDQIDTNYIFLKSNQTTHVHEASDKTLSPITINNQCPNQNESLDHSIQSTNLVSLGSENIQNKLPDNTTYNSIQILTQSNVTPETASINDTDENINNKVSLDSEYPKLFTNLVAQNSDKHHKCFISDSHAEFVSVDPNLTKSHSIAKGRNNIEKTEHFLNHERQHIISAYNKSDLSNDSTQNLLNENLPLQSIVSNPEELSTLENFSEGTDFPVNAVLTFEPDTVSSKQQQIKTSSISHQSEVTSLPECVDTLSSMEEKRAKEMEEKLKTKQDSVENNSNQFDSTIDKNKTNNTDLNASHSSDSSQIGKEHFSKYFYSKLYDNDEGKCLKKSNHSEEKERSDISTQDLILKTISSDNQNILKSNNDCLKLEESTLFKEHYSEPKVLNLSLTTTTFEERETNLNHKNRELTFVNKSSSDHNKIHLEQNYEHYHQKNMVNMNNNNESRTATYMYGVAQNSVKPTFKSNYNHPVKFTIPFKDSVLSRLPSKPQLSSMNRNEMQAKNKMTKNAYSLRRYNIKDKTRNQQINKGKDQKSTKKQIIKDNQEKISLTEESSSANLYKNLEVIYEDNESTQQIRKGAPKTNTNEKTNSNELIVNQFKKEYAAKILQKAFRNYKKQGERKSAAAVIIQRAYRCYRLKFLNREKRLRKEDLKETKAANLIQKNFKNFVRKRKEKHLLESSNKITNAALIIQKVFKRNLQLKSNKKLKERLVVGYDNSCINDFGKTFIQIVNNNMENLEDSIKKHCTILDFSGNITPDQLQSESHFINKELRLTNDVKTDFNTNCNGDDVAESLFDDQPKALLAARLGKDEISLDSLENQTAESSPDDSLEIPIDKISETDKVIDKMSCRRASESLSNKSTGNIMKQLTFDEPVIKTMRDLQQESCDSNQSNDVIISEDWPNDIKHYTLMEGFPGQLYYDPKTLNKSVTIDETIKYIEPPTDATSIGSFCLDDDTSENIRKQMMAYSLSEADSDYYGTHTDNMASSMDKSHISFEDDFNINTALLDKYETSTETESTIVSAVTKIQARARGFLTRKRLRHFSCSTKSSLPEDYNASFGNIAINESLEKLIENEAAKKIQNAFRKHLVLKLSNFPNINHINDYNSSQYNIDSMPISQTASLENSLAARRLTLQRGIALRNDSNPDDNQNTKNNQIINKKPIKVSIKSHPIMKNDVAIKNLRYNKNYLLGKRQNSMPVQIDSEVLRVVPKHIRKRVKSADLISKFA